MSLGELVDELTDNLDRRSSAEVTSLRKRRAVVRYDDHENFWYVVYYKDGRRMFVIDWATWDSAMCQALEWVGLAQ